MAEAQAMVDEETSELCKEIVRISSGGTSLSFGELFEDDKVQQTFESLMGTLKAARKRGLIEFEGEMLLKGQNDSVVISLTSRGSSAASGEAAPAEADEAKADAETSGVAAAEPEGSAEAPAAELAPAAAAAETTEEKPAGFDFRGLDADAAPPSNLLPEAAEEPPSNLLPEAAEEPPSNLLPEAAEAAEAAAAPAAAEAAAADSSEPLPSNCVAEEGLPKSESKKWEVDTSYIDRRTQDVDRLEPRRGAEEKGGVIGPDTVPGTAIASAAKTEDGKWQQVDTSYVDWRTQDVNNLEARKTTTAGGEVDASTKSAKDEDGKWQQVSTGYIDWRTKDPNRLESRRSKSEIGGISSVVIDASAGVSATTKKESDGKWKVDTSYIGYRTGDTANLDRKLETSSDPTYDDPAEKKYSYEEIKGANRPASVDPKQKEVYLADAEFETVFGMTPDAFTKLPKWKQQNMKKAKDLF